MHCHTCCFKWIFALRLFYSSLLVNNNHRRNDSKQPNQDHLCSSKSLILKKKIVIEFCQSSQIKKKSFFFTGYGHVLKVLGKQHYCVLTFFIIYVDSCEILKCRLFLLLQHTVSFAMYFFKISQLCVNNLNKSL